MYHLFSETIFDFLGVTVSEYVPFVLVKPLLISYVDPIPLYVTLVLVVSTIDSLCILRFLVCHLFVFYK